MFVAQAVTDPQLRALAIDARFYHDMGVRFAQGDVLFGPGPLWFAPLYPYVVGACYRAFGAFPGVVLALQLALGVLTAWLGWRVAARFSRGAGLVAGLLLALTPVSPVYEIQLLYTAVAVALTAAYLAAQLRAARREALAPAFGAGALLGLLSLASASALLFAPFGAWRLDGARRARRALAFAAGVALPLLPVLVRNGVVGGEWTPITANGGMLLATGFAPESLGGRALLRTPSDFGPGGAYVREAEAATGREMTLAEASRWHRDAALARIRDDPAWAAGLVARKIGLLANAREIDDNLGPSSFAERVGMVRFAPAPWAWFALGAVAGIGFALRRRDAAAGEARTLALFAVVYAASLLPFFVTARYRLPLVVPCAVLAGFAFHATRDAWRAGRRRELVAPGLIVLACAPLVFRDPGVREDPALRRNATGAALLGEGRAAEALALLDRAIAEDPALPGAHANRALALLELGRSEEALAAATEAARLDPALASAWQTRGAILARGGRMEEAVESFRRAAELGPRDPVAWGNLARALAETGRYAEAAAAGRTAEAAGAPGMAALVAGWEETARAGAGGTPMN